jgi:hypothetical protein
MHLDAVAAGKAGDAQWVTGTAQTSQIQSSRRPKHGWEYIAIPWCGEAGLRRNLRIVAEATVKAEEEIKCTSSVCYFKKRMDVCQGLELVIIMDVLTH